MQRLLAWLSLVLLAACAPSYYATNYTSFVDPAFRGQVAQARAVLVMAPTLSLSRRQAAETAMAEVLRRSGLPVVLGLDVFPPTRGTPTTEDVLAELRQRGLDGAVVLWNTAERVDVHRGTRTVTDSEYETRIVNGQRRLVRVEVRREVPTTEEVPVAAYAAQFVLPAGPIVWTAEGTFAGGSFQGLAGSAGTGVIAKLQADGLLANPAAAPGQGPVPAQPGPAAPGDGLILPGLR